MEWLVTFIFAAIAAQCLMWYLNRKKKHAIFKRIGVPFVEPHIIYGSDKELRAVANRHEVLQEWRKKYGKVFGFFIGGNPMLVISDLSMLKQILIKDFSKFPNRPERSIRTEPFQSTLLQLKDQRWKEVRSLLSPTFSASKMKLMTEAMHIKSDIMIDLMLKAEKKGEGVDVYDIFQGLTLDVICETALAYQWNNQGKMSAFILNNLKRVISIRRNMTREQLQKVDVLQLMLEASETIEKNGRPNYTSHKISQKVRLHDRDIIANAFVFLLAGFETTAAALTFTCYLLAKNEDVQDKLYESIMESVPDEDEELTYDRVTGMKYLDQVLTESLRLLPPVGQFGRRAAETTEVEGLKIPKHMTVVVPAWDIQRNPDNWEEPETFNPERFSADAPPHDPLAYLPFGTGPRVCIGKRFALLEAKIALTKVVRKFRMKFTGTEDVRFVAPGATMAPEKGLKLTLIERE